MTPNLVIRRTTVEDAAIIALHRVAMFTDMGIVPTAELAGRLLESSTSALREALGKESYVGWFALDGEDQVIAGAGIYFMPQLPRISEDRTFVVSSSMPVVQNVYTEPAWRKRGVARALMLKLMQWAEEHSLDRLVLHASDEGRPLYVSLGFGPTREMSARPRHPSGITQIG
jgi:GNAT superfamily N-acetyltransferase